MALDAATLADIALRLDEGPLQAIVQRIEAASLTPQPR